MNCTLNAIEYSATTSMNSSDDLPFNGVLEDSASSSQLPNSDSNANLNNGNQNKGAIPKTKIPKSTKKSAKLNNNVDEVTSKGSAVTEDVLQMHTDMLRLNGFSDQLSRISSSYLDDYKSTLYGSSDACENCCGVSKTSYNDIFTDESSQHEASKLLSYQPGTSAGKSDTNFQFVADSDSSDNELLSISDDGCIYTYKGDQAADLPSSFFTLDIPPSRSPEIHPPRQENASPEMDFLEMDFDPGPSGDADSDSQSNADLENAENLPQDPLHHVAENIKDQTKLRIDEPIFSGLKSPLTEDSARSSSCRAVDLHLPQPSTSAEPYTPASPSTSIKQDSPMSTITERFRKMRMPWSCSMSERTTTRFGSRISKRHLTSTGELTSPSERIPTADDFAYFGSEKATGDSLPREKVLIWTEEEAFRKQVTQIGASACGATAVINVLKALRLPLPPVETIKDSVKTRLRANSSPLAEYLLSRSVAGSTHEDLIEGLLKATEGQVFARFFHMYPERVVNLHSWLQFWISHGAVPIATLNLQKCVGPIPDAWHHQMIFGVGPKGIYLTNPLECVDPGQLWPQLSSESQLLIRKEDIFSRWNIQTDLEQLIDVTDEKWFKMNVVGQVANLMRESTREKRLGFASTSHIKIPAAYSSGITLVMKVDDPLCPLLRFCSELPILPQNDGATGCSDFY